MKRRDLLTYLRSLAQSRRRRRGPSFAITDLFTNDEQGIWYDHSDLATLWRWTDGKVPVGGADGEPVGVRLDKKTGVGTTGNVVPGVVEGIINTGSTDEALVAGTGFLTTEWFPLIPGDWYLLEPIGGTATRRRVQTKDAGGVITFQAGLSFEGTPINTLFQAPAGAVQMRVYFKQDIETATGLLVRRVLGPMGLQSSLGARPFYRPATAHLDFDTIGDALVTTFPVSLGSSCTVARSIPGVGAQILTDQTVGTSWSDNVDSCAVVIVDRALTTEETESLTALLDEAAGV